MEAFPIIRMKYAEDEPALSNHTHPACELIFVKQGAARLTIDGREYEAGPGTLVLLGALEQHELEITARPYVRYFCIFSPQALEQRGIDPALATVFKNRPYHFSHCLKLKNPEAVEKLLQQMEQEYMGRAPYADQMALDLLEALLICLYRESPGHFFRPETAMDTKVWEVQRYLEAHYAEPVSIAALAAERYVSPDHLARSFKELTGYSPKQYLSENRLLHSRQMLLQTSLPVGTVAFRCGFPDANNFIRTFKRRYGVTPKQFQQSRSSGFHHTANGEK
ncbi:MAG: helix-turn-helix domain-containing protein [Oscillospiraceae bacterium]